MKGTDDLITTSEVARLLDVSSQRIRQLVHERADFPQPASATQTLRGIGTRRWRRADIVSWCASADRARGRANRDYGKR